MRTLQQLIDAMERCHPDSSVQFDFGGLSPSGLASYRGYYSDLAIGFSEAYPRPTVAAFTQSLKEAVGECFSGWKGGRYLMDVGTTVWVANMGDTSGTRVAYVEEYCDGGPGRVIIHTKYEDD